jgi:hypothetical protein
MGQLGDTAITLGGIDVVWTERLGAEAVSPTGWVLGLGVLRIIEKKCQRAEATIGVRCQSSGANSFCSSVVV